MMTVNDVSKMTGVSIRTLHYYDEIGLLKPAKYTDSDYRLYDDAALEKLQQILLFKELEFPLKDIKEIVNRSDFTKLFEEFGTMKGMDPASEEVQAQVKKVQDFITEHMYTCTDDILYGLGTGYVGGGELTQNIEKMGGEGTSEFIFQAIKIYCGK